MAKAALNMLTRTSAEEMFADGILMTSVDTGWITDERPHPTKMRLAGEGFHAPLDLVDGAARVYDPIVRGEQGEDLYGCFLKDYAPIAWSTIVIPNDSASEATATIDAFANSSSMGECGPISSVLPARPSSSMRSRSCSFWEPPP
jgi:NAD(P)-dependent dehydrogenase (short-subunit alcohol dehydrogenase family)